MFRYVPLLATVREPDIERQEAVEEALGNMPGPLRSRRRSAGPSLRNQDVAEVVDDRHGRRHFRFLRQVSLDLVFGASGRRLEPVQHVADLLDREHAFFDQPVDHGDHHIAHPLRGGAGHLDSGFRQFPIPLIHFPLLRSCVRQACAKAQPGRHPTG